MASRNDKEGRAITRLYSESIARGGKEVLTRALLARMRVGQVLEHPGSIEVYESHPGRYCPHAGMSEPNPCSAGTFSSVYGAAECEECSVGRYQDKDGMPYCKGCPSGKYNEIVPRNSNTSCLPCAMGTFSV